jgi:REP element-mobilizing transposase RayT
MVWSVKYRRKILNSGIEEYLKELVQQIAEDKGFTVHEQVAKRIVNVRFTVVKETMSTAL